MTGAVGLRLAIALYPTTRIALEPATETHPVRVELGGELANQVTVGFSTPEEAERLAAACVSAAAAMRRQNIHAVEFDR